MPYATNQLPLATDQNGELFLGCGYQGNVRLRSVLELEETDYSFITGFIPVRYGDVIYFSGNCFRTDYDDAKLLNTAIYDTGKYLLGRTTMAEYAEEIHIGNNVWIACNTVVIGGVTIGDGAVIGAGSVVTKDIPSNVVAVGNPCRVLREVGDHDREYYWRDKKIDPKLFEQK